MDKNIIYCSAYREDGSKRKHHYKLSISGTQDNGKLEKQRQEMLKRPKVQEFLKCDWLGQRKQEFKNLDN